MNQFMITQLSLIISVTALLISLWGRIEAYLISKRQTQVEQAKRVGNALIAAQILKNTLSDNIESLETAVGRIPKSHVDSVVIDKEFMPRLEILKKEYE